MVALGDSLTEGLGDPVPGGGWRGWAALLAAGLRPGGEGVELHNLAVSGALTGDLPLGQLAAACDLGPQLAALVVGANDTLRAGYDIRTITVNLDAALAALTAQGATVLTACLPDPGRMLGLPGPLARPLARRMRSVNEVVHALDRRYGTVHVHIAGSEWVDDPRMWSVDRLHPSERGHRALARQFHQLLRADGTALGPPPGAEPQGPPPTRGAQTRWMATKGTAWVVDRCTDLLPELLRLALTEAGHRRRGETAELDRRAAADTAAALRAALERPRPGRRDTGRPGPGRYGSDRPGGPSPDLPDLADPWAAQPARPAAVTTNRAGVPGRAWAAAARSAAGTTPTTG
ncbi:SGNH/GDSL hydrolase family protein [Streptacidiphilus sp. 4-A2]|nr:SGNH/GDSL hydrolase family protein [Streptacidiphilus sp. 4-A2]